ncbi:MAG: dihydrolipoyl dehydrogenase [Desulfovibrionaceae bacterium]|nr:dihydrolipoyl dehydrogenase [Desulfovibrionaceae bacterium]
MRLCIIGGGPAGYTAAFAAAQEGMDVTVVERANLGGTCLNWGCIPTKTLRTSADAMALLPRLASLGIDAEAKGVVNLERLRQRKNTVINTLREGLSKSFAAQKITHLQGQASLAKDSQGAPCVKVQGAGSEETVAADAIIIATGSQVLQLPGLTFDHEFICSSDDALNLTRIPEDLIIVGGGVIGCELACIYRSFGSNVTIVEGQDRLLPLPSVDGEVSTLLARELRKQKIRLVLGKTVKDTKIIDQKVHGVVAKSPFTKNPAVDDEETPISGDMLLVTVGRVPTTSGLGLDTVGVEVDKRGWIPVDSQFMTNVPQIFAAGDILGPSHVMLAHVAAAEGLAIVNHLCGKPASIDYKIIPSAIFTDPEIGEVGLSEEEALKQGYSVVSGTSLMRELGKAQAMAALPGFFKIVADATTHEILGAHIVGAHASDIVAEAALAIKNKLKLEDVVTTIHAHPTLAEGFFEAATRTLQKIN